MLRFSVYTDGLEDALARVKKAASAAEIAVAAQVEKDTRKFVPFRTGSLANRTHLGQSVSADEEDHHLLKDSIEESKKARDSGLPVVIYPGPYARFLYYGKVMVDPETGSAWARPGASKVTTDKDLVFTTDFNSQAQSHWFEASKAQNMEKWVRVADKAVKDDLRK